MDNKLKLNLPLLLPDIDDDRDRCVERLLTLLKSRNGVVDAHVKLDEDRKPLLCIHYDQHLMSLGQVRQLAKISGAEITERYGHLSIDFSNSISLRTANRIERRLAQLSGVIDVSLSPIGHLYIEYDKKTTDQNFLQTQASQLLKSDELKLAGDRDHERGHEHDEKKELSHGGQHKHGGIFGEKTELIFSVLAATSLMIGWAVSQFSLSNFIPSAAYLLSYFFGGYFASKEAFENLKERKFEIDSLMVLAAAGAAFLGEWPEGALLLSLFSLGHALENFAMGRARRAVEALAKLAPETAFVKTTGQFQEVPVKDLKPGNIILVKPNERIAADGFVTKGESSVDQAPITGESVPVDKKAITENAPEKDRLDSRHKVFAGTINGPGAMEIQVTRASSESTLAKVVDMVNEAEARKSPTQLFTDKFERIFVPFILVFVAILPFGFFVIEETWQTSLYRALAVLVAASPCALAIATPSAVLSAVARAARGGVLVKGGAPLEELGALEAIAFDKTGTLTEGRPKVTDVIPMPGAKSSELLEVLVAIEKLSDHPLAAAIVRYGEEQKITPGAGATEVKSITGKGVSGFYRGKAVLVGKKGLFAEKEALPLELAKAVEQLELGGRTVMIAKADNQFLGSVGLMDIPRESAKVTIRRLRDLGIKRMIMLSGDNQGVASSVAAALGLTDARGDLMPEDKVRVIQELKLKERVAMVGDGVNDAPAMVSASVGIAMGAAGSDVALQTADVALMADDLSALPFAVGLSRRARLIVKQNLWVSLGMVAFLVPATLFGLNIGMAVAAHEGSTILVVINALRLLAYRNDSRE